MKSFSLKWQGLRLAISLQIGIALGLGIHTTASAKIGKEYQLALGNPTKATSDATKRENYLILRPQYALSYNETRLQPNWVSWSYSTGDSGSVPRGPYLPETELPADYSRLGTETFGSYYDVGHMAPHADRHSSIENSAATFRMSNMIPQAGLNHNRGLWMRFEAYCREMASDGDEVLIISGPCGYEGVEILPRIANPSGCPVPRWVWKIAVEVPSADSSLPAQERITKDCRVIAILTPNTNELLSTNWIDYITTVEKLEGITGLEFFEAIQDAATAVYLKNIKDTGEGPDQPTVITGFEPDVALPGSNVMIYGYNFGTSPRVWFGDTLSTNVTVVGNGTISALVPSMQSGFQHITVNSSSGGAGQSDVSYEELDILPGSLPYLRISNSTLTGFVGSEGRSGATLEYRLSGGNLNTAVNVTVSGEYEVAVKSGVFNSTVSIAPTNRVISGAVLRVRLKSTAPSGVQSGSIGHSTTGTLPVILQVSGKVRSATPHLEFSAAPLPTLIGIQGRASKSENFTLTGYNLVGSIRATAPAGVELSNDNVVFRTTFDFPPLAGFLNKPIYVRLAKTAPAGFLSGNIVFTGGGIPTSTKTVSWAMLANGMVETLEWNMNSLVPSTGFQATVQAGPLSVGPVGSSPLPNSTSASSGYAGASGGNNILASARKGLFEFDDEGSGGSSYFEFQLQPALGLSMAINRISFGTRSTATGPTAYSIRSSLDNYETECASGLILADSKWKLVEHSLLGITVPDSGVKLRIYGFQGSGTAPNWRIDDLKVEASLALVPLAVPTVQSPAHVTGRVGTPFTHKINATNSASGFSASGLPIGLSINATSGLISGVPLVSGNRTAHVNAANAVGAGIQKLAFSIEAPAPVVKILGQAIGRVGLMFNYKMSASNAPSSFGASGLPNGLLMNATTGVISGNPAESGNFTVQLSATNSSGTGTNGLDIRILPSAPVILGPSSINATVGSFFSSAVSATNLPIRYTATGLPSGLSINATSGRLEGIPRVDGTFHVSLSAVNSGGTGRGNLTLTIHPILPVFTSIAAIGIRQGSSIQFQAKALNAPRSFSASSLPDGLSIHAKTGLITGTATQAGNYTSVLKATNSAGTTSQLLLVQVLRSLP